MVWLDFLFGKKPLTATKIAKATKLATNPFAQADVRQRELERLLADGSDLAMAGLLKRFTVNAQGHIADETEKKWVENALTDVGEAVLPVLVQYLETEQQLAYPLRVYQRIAGVEAATACFLRILQGYGPDNHRAASAKLQLVLQLTEQPSNDQQLAHALLDFVNDHSDDVAWAVLHYYEQLVSQQHVPAGVQSPLLAALTARLFDGLSSPRIGRAAAAVLAAAQWPLPPVASELSGDLAVDFWLDKKRIVRRRLPSSRSA